MLRTANKAFFLLSVLLGMTLAGTARAQQYVLSEASELWLSGTSTVNSFECEAETLLFDHDVDHFIEGNGFSVPGVSLVVPVRDLDCSNRRMNRDLQDALHADEFPEIRLDVFRMDLLPEAAADREQPDVPQVAFHGRMTLAGVSRDITILLSGWLDQFQRLHGKGTLDVKMTDFGVEPPTALFGLVKAHDDISIRFHLMANPEGGETGALSTSNGLPSSFSMDSDSRDDAGGDVGKSNEH